jgi:glycerophosphoryl diester phosphodiesterase
VLFLIIKILNTILIAHRGYSGKYPENTLLAFQKAIDSKAHGIELDVHLSVDDEIIVFHDSQVLYKNKHTQINSLTVSEIKSIDLAENQKIPTLIEVLNLIDKKVFLNIELKGKNTAKKVVEIINNYIENKNWNNSHFLISSFDKDLLMEVNFLNSNLRLGIITNKDLELAFDFAKYLKIYSIHPHFSLLDLAETQRLQFRNFKVYPWTINEKQDKLLMKSFGVNGIITDFL